MSNRPIRVLIAKIGLDGHDRGAKLIVRNLRDAGMEVIYTGLWQTPAATVNAAIQEDVDVLGISLLSAAHMTVIPEVIRLCREAGAPDMPVVMGGIVPEQDKPKLRDVGCAGVFNPGTPMSAIIDSIRTLATQRRAAHAAANAPLDIRSNVGLARALTMVSAGIPWAAGSGPAKPSNKGGTGVPPVSKKPRRIGVTGAPGVGKSTFIGKLARRLRERQHKVGVICVDPTSPLTGGALLGDRLRMMSAEADDGLFIRSLSSGGAAGGLAPFIAEVTDLLGAAGYDVVLIETVGAGQNDVEIRKVADEVLLLQMPGAGDSIQFEKAGIAEIATGFVVNKADLPGADKTVAELRGAVDDQRPVWPVSALRGEGLDPLCDWIEK